MYDFILLPENETLKDHSNLKNFTFQIFVIRFTLCLNYTKVPFFNESTIQLMSSSRLVSYTSLLKKRKREIIKDLY